MLRLLPSTPHPVIYFLAGCLPGEALIHLRQLSLLGMISRLPGSLLHRQAMNVYSSKGSWSWFHQVRDVCLKYQIPHPLNFLTSPISKEAFKNLVKKQVLRFWELKLREEASPLLSLAFFKPQFMSLSKPHPLFTTAGSSPYEVTKSGVQALFLSGRYRTELLSRYWSSNPEGFCLCPSCDGHQVKEDIEHILLYCPSLSPSRQRLYNFTSSYARSVPAICETILTLSRPTHPLFSQFLLDCSVIPCVISLVQQLGDDVLHHMFKISRTWCYSLHRERLRILGRWTQ